MKLPFLTDSNGNKSASLTMMIVAFTVVMLWLLLSIFENIAGMPVREFSGAEAMLVLAPIMSLYFGRRWQNEKKPEGAALDSGTDSTDTEEEEGK